MKEQTLTHVYNIFFTFPDPRVSDFLFMSSPVTITLILAAYLNFVLSSGPKWMRHRQPFNIDQLLVVYNFLQIIACSYLVYAVNI